MNLEKTSKEIIKAVGGEENIVHLTHCMTRLRFTLQDDSLVQTDQLEKIEGVMGSVNGGGVYQVIIGTNVDKVYDVISAQLNHQSTKEENKKGPISRVLDLISATLSPLVPVIMGAGFISILLALLNQFGILTSESTTYTLLNNIANCVYYFFPVLIALSLSSRLKVNQVFAVICACFLLYPDFTNMFAAASEAQTQVTFFAVPVLSATYSKQIIPIFLSVFAQKYIEKIVYRFTPKVIRSMVGSGIILILTVFVTITILGPAGATLTTWLNNLVYFIVDNCGWVAVPIMAFLNPFFLATGLGSANFPIMLMSYVSNGYEALILPAALAGNAVQAGAGFAVAMKTKNKEFRSVSFESALTALMGITEPIIFTVHYRLKKTFIPVMVGSAIAAILPGITRVACYAMATGILSLPAYLPGGVMNLVWACVTFVSSLIIGFVLTYLTKFEDPKEGPEELNA